MPLYCTKGHDNPSNSRFCQTCGEKLPLAVAQSLSHEIILGEHYRVERQLGHGGFGRAYLAYDLHRFNEPCVLKEFAPQVQGSYALQKAEELFEREAGVLYKLQHPQIPRFRELFRANLDHEGRLFLVQDYVDGYSYHTLLDHRKLQGQRFTEAEVTQLMLQMLPVLEYIHNLGVIHRDISPDNMILRTADQLSVLIDFGGVKQVAATVTSQFNQPAVGAATVPVPTRLGKAGYAPDEQMQRGIVGADSDLYALAATVLVLLTGKEPHELIDGNTLSWSWQREVSLSPLLGSVLDKMLQHRPRERYQSAREVLQALTNSLPASADYPPTPPATQGTVAVVPPRNKISPVAVASKLPVASVTGQFQGGILSLLGKVLLVSMVIVGATWLGWWAGNLWLKTHFDDQKQPDSAESPDSSSPADPEKLSPQFSAEEKARKQALRDRQIAWGVDDNFYISWVNEAFWDQYPDQKGRRLGNGPEDQQWRERWDKTAADLLSQLEKTNLSVEARQGMGRYNSATRERWKQEANRLHISSPALYDLADTPFFQQFPQQQGQEILDKPIGQVWQAFVADSLQAAKSGTALETIRFTPGTTRRQYSNSLKSGQGKIYIAQLSAGQLMQLQLQASSNILLSVYTPTGKTKILEDSSQRSWSGKLPESGYYEIVLVSQGSAITKYELNLTVETPVTPTPSLESSPSNPI